MDESDHTAPRARRRRFTVDDKLRILAEADACTEWGATEALLRREGVYSSALSAWRAQRDAGVRAALGPHTPATGRQDLERERSRLRQEGRRLRRELAQARATMATQSREVGAMVRQARRERPAEAAAILDAALAELREHRSIVAACRALGLPRSTYYSHRRPRPAKPRQPRRYPRPAADQQNWAAVEAALARPQFAGASPRTVWAALHAGGVYRASLSTFYRTLRAQRAAHSVPEP